MFNARWGASSGLRSNRAGTCRSLCSRILLALSIFFAIEALPCWSLLVVKDSAAGMTSADRQKLRQALAAYDEGRPAEARPGLEDLLIRHPANFQINEVLGLIHAEAGDLIGALPLLEHAEHLQPDKPMAHANLGVAYLKLMRPQQALIQLKIAARLDARDQQTQLNLARAYLETSQPSEAARAFAAAAAIAPISADISHDRVVALLRSNDLAGAKDVLDTLPTADRNDGTEALYGEVEERRGNYLDAERHFSDAAHLNPSEMNIHAWVVELLRHFSWQPAIKVAEFGLERYPDSTGLKIARGIGHYGDNRYREAAADFSSLLDIDPENAMYAELLGRSCELVSDPESTSCEKLQHFADQHPHNAEASTYAAASLLHRPAEQRDDAKARILLEHATQVDPKLADAYYQLGVLDQEEMEWDQSTMPLEKAIELRPYFAEAHYRLGRAYSHLGRRSEAAKEIELQQHYAKEQKAAIDARLKSITTFLVAQQ
jgi:tetratricopeptide (TPR) repeat protein